MDTNEYVKPVDKDFSGINFNYVSIDEINHFFIRLLNIAKWEVGATGFPKVDIFDEDDPGARPEIVYTKEVKTRLLQKRDCWRTYKYNKVNTVEQVNFRFNVSPLDEITSTVTNKNTETNILVNSISKSTMYRKLKEINIKK